MYPTSSVRTKGWNEWVWIMSWKLTCSASSSSQTQFIINIKQYHYIYPTGWVRLGGWGTWVRSQDWFPQFWTRGISFSLALFGCRIKPCQSLFQHLGLIVTGREAIQDPTSAFWYSPDKRQKRISCQTIKTIWVTARENLTSGFATRVDSNRPAQLQKLGRALKFRIYKLEVLYYLGSKQLRCWPAPLLFAYGKNRFSHDVAHFWKLMPLSKSMKKIFKAQYNDL